MKTFKDKTGQPWELNLTAGLAMRVRREDERFDLFDSSKQVGGQPLSTALHDFPTFFELLFLLVESQAKERGINAEQFGDLMAADCLVDARSAFFAEWRDFFQGLQLLDHAAAIEKLNKYNAEALELVKQAIAETGPKVDQYVTNQMATAMSAKRGSLAALLESTPDPTR
jgi:hypothetical protein